MDLLVLESKKTFSPIIMTYNVQRLYNGQTHSQGSLRLDPRGRERASSREQWARSCAIL